MSAVSKAESGFEGATAVITHRVQAGQESQYEAWLEEISPLSQRSPGLLHWHLIPPIAGQTQTYTVLLRFDTHEHLLGWMHSEQRQALIAKVRPFLATDDDFFVRSGLDFWFVPEGAKAHVPVQWKQYLLTWSAIFPLALIVPRLLIPVLRRLGVPPLPLLDTLCVTGVLVFCMVYLVMPRYTRLVQRWLFR